MHSCRKHARHLFLRSLSTELMGSSGSDSVHKGQYAKLRGMHYSRQMKTAFERLYKKPAKNGISYDMCSAKQQHNLFKAPVELTVLVFDPVSCIHSCIHSYVHPHPPLSPPPRKLQQLAPLPEVQHSQLCYWVSSHNGLRRAIEIRCCAHTKVWWDTDCSISLATIFLHLQLKNQTKKHEHNMRYTDQNTNKTACLPCLRMFDNS